MVKYNWTYKCDYCEEVVHDETQFLFYANQPIIIPNPIPASYPCWRTVDGLLVCPKHTVNIEDKENNEQNP